MTDETADMCFVGLHRDRDLAVTDDISSATAGIAAGNKTGAVDIPLDFARDTQILDGIIPGKAKGCYIVKRIPKIVVQRMAVTIEMSSECEILCWTYEVFCIDVGIEACVHVVLALGLLHHVAEGHPVGIRADREEIGFYAIPCVYGRCTLFDKEFDVVVHARSRECH